MIDLVNKSERNSQLKGQGLSSNYFRPSDIISVVVSVSTDISMPSADNFDLPLAKRQKRVSQVKAGTRGSKIFAPFRVS